ncbi:hypothetical protein [Aeromicrobium sp. Sec7.5]|uniref:hypothetical protein n=1 Tax=Aeromicrobium sp. Sec7.5 TaxID=3121276 RepID=UPI002FE4B7C2
MKWPLSVLLMTVLTGLAGAVVWVQLAEPARWTVADGSLQMGQEAVTAQFAVSIAFAVVGLGGGLLLGFLLGVLARPVGWPLVVVAAGAGAVATLIAWQLGMVWGPPDPSTVSGVSTGDTIPDELTVTIPAAFLAWSIAAIAGLLPGVALNPSARADARAEEQRWQKAASSAAHGRHDPHGEVDQVLR